MDKQKMVNQVSRQNLYFQKRDENSAKFFSKIVELTILSRKTLEISENDRFQCPDHLPGVHKMEKQKMVNQVTRIFVHFQKRDKNCAKFFSKIVELTILSRKILEISENDRFECPDH